MSSHLFSTIPQIETLLQRSSIASYINQLSRPLVINILRQQVEQYRQRLRQEVLAIEVLYHSIDTALMQAVKQRLQPVINGTGIMIHTNLGRAPISQAAWQQTSEIVCRYTNLELDLVHGKRGNRMGLLPQLLQALCGAQDSLLVNNNAAALYLLLSTFAQGKEVLVSRGEQVQIGGGFRIPDIVSSSGAILRDVGTTNITTANDYLDAITDNTALVLIVHSSNYYIEGFTASPDLVELRARLPQHILLVVDQGSGNQEQWLPGELTVEQYLQAGADLVCFSTDKMLGCTQGGLLVGKQLLIDKMKKHPLMRVVRPGKVTYALLETQLIQRLNKQDSHQQRLFNLASQSLAWHRARAEVLSNALGEAYSVVPTTCLVGGGTTPRKEYATFALQLPAYYSVERWLTLLRESTPPIIAVSRQDRVWLLPISLLDGDIPIVIEFLQRQEPPCTP